jgi:hypothetical protein
VKEDLAAHHWGWLLAGPVGKSECRPGRDERQLAQPARRCPGPAGVKMPAQPGLAALCRPGWPYSDLASDMPARETIIRPRLLLTCFLNIHAYTIHSYNIHKSYRQGYFGIPGVISPTLAPEAVGDSQSRAQASTRICQSTKLIYS